jgi:DNA transformation protein
MFGGLGLYCEGTFFAVVDNDRLFFKVDAETEGAYEALGADGWVIEGDPPAPMPYREVPASILSDPGQLGEWIDAAVGVALRKKGGSSKKKKPIAEG